jgi:phenylalanyl-tRNA synthetase beta chain
MKVSSRWIRSYLSPISVSDTELANALTLRGLAVEGKFFVDGYDGDREIHNSLFEMDITTNRVDAMNHYGIAREAALIYGLVLKPLETELPKARPGSAHPVYIEEPKLCGRFTARVLRNVMIGSSHDSG